MAVNPRRLLLAAFAATVLAACASPPGGNIGVSSGGESLPGNYLAARAARAANDNQAAILFYREALAEDPDNPNLIRRVFLLEVALGDLGAASGSARRLLQFDESDAAAQLVLAASDLRQQRYPEVLRRIDTIGRGGLNILLSPVIAAWAEAGAGRIDAGLAALAPLNSSEALAALHGFHTALINEYGGRPQAAEAAYRGTLDRATGGTQRLIEAYGRFLAREGRADEARALYAGYLERNPDSPVVNAALQALSAGAQAPLVDGPAAGAAEGFYTAAAVLGRDDAAEVVEIYLQIALHLAPRLDAARMMLGELYESRRRWADAMDTYRRVPAQSPLAEQARLRQAWAVHSDGRTEEAITQLRAATDERPQAIDALVMLGDMLRGKERYGEAAEAYGRAIGRVPQPNNRHWILFYTRGIAFERSKQWPRAEADFQRALQLSPDQPLVLNYLGYSWVDRGERLDEARRMIERAVELRPNDGFIVDSLGWVLYRLGRFEEAVVRLERAVELQPDDPVINDHLGDAYWRVGRRVEARFQWERSLNLKPEPDARNATQRKLVEGLPPLPADGRPLPQRAANGG